MPSVYTALNALCLLYILHVLFPVAVVMLNPLATDIGFPSTVMAIDMFNANSANVRYRPVDETKVVLFRPYLGKLAPTQPKPAVPSLAAGLTSATVKKAKLSTPINSGRAELRAIRKHSPPAREAMEAVGWFGETKGEDAAAAGGEEREKVLMVVA